MVHSKTYIKRLLNHPARLRILRITADVSGHYSAAGAAATAEY